MTITDILAKYGSDKVTGHRYGPVYEKIFGGFDRDAQLDLMEIGVQNGGSIMAWAEYFPHANIHGMDIVDVRKPEWKSARARFILGDVNLTPVEGRFDIVIDDGSHQLPDVLNAVRKFLPLLKPGGVIIVEDVQQPKPWLFQIAKLAGIFRIMTGKIRYYDMRAGGGGIDDFIVTIRK